jgi:hypothetical protein
VTIELAAVDTAVVAIGPNGVCLEVFNPDAEALVARCQAYLRAVTEGRYHERVHHEADGQNRVYAEITLPWGTERALRGVGLRGLTRPWRDWPRTDYAVY